MRTQAQTKSDAHPSWSFFDSCHPDLNTTFTESACFILKWIFVTRSVLFCLTPASSEGEDVIIGIKKYLRNQHLVLKRSFLFKKKCFHYLETFGVLQRSHLFSMKLWLELDEACKIDLKSIKIIIWFISCTFGIPGKLRNSNFSLFISQSFLNVHEYVSATDWESLWFL